MYIENVRSGYQGNGQQVTRRGRFLMLVQPAGVAGCDSPIKAIVRKVAMRQCGAWMMGVARVMGRTLTLSGAYGADGLTMGVDDDIYARAVAVPAQLVEMWNKGGGWNSCGSEAPAMRMWALEHMDELTA